MLRRFKFYSLLFMFNFLITICSFIAVDSYAAKAKNKANPSEGIRNLSQENYYTTIGDGVTEEDLRKAEDLRVQTLASIKDLLKKRTSKQRRFELLLREGELHAERHDYLRELEVRQYDQEYSKWIANSKKGKEPQLQNKKSKMELTKAAESFRKLTAEFPKHPRTAAALFAAAKTLARLGSDDSIKYYQNLLKNFPNSNFIPDAHLAMGEFYFEKYEMEKSRSAYLSAMKFKDHRAYAYASYKLAWTYYNSATAQPKNQDEYYTKALTAFKLVVKVSEKNTKLGRINLRQEALNDMVIVWAEQEDIEGAWAYLKSVDEKNAFYALLERLGNTYSDQGKNQKAIAQYKRLLDEAPERPNNYKIHVRMLAMYEAESNYDGLVKTVEQMKNTYSGSSKWISANQNSPQILAEASKALEFNMHRYSTLLHSRGDKSKNQVMLSSAMKLYGLYLSAFPNAKPAYEIRYYYAELLMNRKQFEAAKDQYLLVASVEDQNKHKKASSLSAVVAMNRVDANTKYESLPPAGKVSSPIKIPENKQKLMDTIAFFLKRYPQDKESLPMKYTVAQTYFDYGHYEEALSRYNALIEQNPSSTQAQSAAVVIVAYYADKKDYDNVSKYSESFLANKKLDSQNMRSKILGIWKGTSLQLAESLEKQGKLEEAAKTYLKYQQRFANDAQADKSLYLASAAYFKLGRIEEALDVGKKIVDSYPNSKYVSLVYADAAQSYEAIGQFEEAANSYVNFANNLPADQRAPNSLYNAAILYKGLKKYERSEKTFKQFLRSYPAHSLKTEALFELADVQLQSKLYAEAYKTLISYINSEANKESEKVILAEAKAADLRLRYLDAKQGRLDVWKVHSKLTRLKETPAVESRNLVAKDIFELAEADYNFFMKLPIQDINSLEKQIQRKQSALVNTAKVYEAIINIKSPEYTVASLYRLGEMHEQFAKTLREVPFSDSVAKVEQEKIKSQLLKLSDPLNSEADKFFQTAFKRSQEGESFSEWTQKSYQKMSERDPKKVPEVVEQSAEASYMTHKIISASVSENRTKSNTEDGEE